MDCFWKFADILNSVRITFTSRATEYYSNWMDFGKPRKTKYTNAVVRATTICILNRRFWTIRISIQRRDETKKKTKKNKITKINNFGSTNTKRKTSHHCRVWVASSSLSWVYLRAATCACVTSLLLAIVCSHVPKPQTPIGKSKNEKYSALCIRLNIYRIGMCLHTNRPSFGHTSVRWQ